MSVSSSKRVLLSLVFLFLFVMCNTLPLSANEPLKEGVDVVLLIDTSGSMRASDKGRNAIEAVNMFIDMLQTKHSRVSVLAFNDKASLVMDMTEITSVSDKEKIKSIVNNFEYDGYTDIGVPLLEGVDKLIKDVRPENSPMLLLLTDGKIEMDPERTDRSDTDSYDDITQALALASNRFPIYTIGLNYNDSVDKQLLHSISTTTKGRSYIIDEAAALPQIFNEIFADHIESSLIEVAAFDTDGEAYDELVIDIQSDFVSEANIIILSGEELSDVKLFDPNGTEAAFNQEDITYSKSKKYSIIKVMTPQRGEWLLKTKGVKDDKIRVNLLYQYNAAISISVTQDGAFKTEYNSLTPLQFKGKLFVNENEYNNSWLYNETKATLIIERSGEVVELKDLAVLDNAFYGDYMPSSEAPIEAYIKVENQHFTKTSNKTAIKFEPIPAIQETTQQTTETTTEPPTTEQVTEPPVTEPEQEPEKENNYIKWVLGILIAIMIISALLIVILLYMRKRTKEFFEGHIEIRMMDDKGKYTPMETPLLNTYVDSFTLHQFVADNLKQKTVEKILKMPIDLNQIIFSPGLEKGYSILYVENKSVCKIYRDNGDNNAQEAEFVWRDGEKLILQAESDRKATIIEMTYRTEEN